MDASSNKPNEPQLTSPSPTTDPKAKSVAKKGCLGCLGLIVLLGIIGAIFGPASRGPSGDWKKDTDLPRGYDNIMVKVDGSILVAAIKIGPAVVLHSGQIAPKRLEEDGGKKIQMLATVKVTAKGVDGLEERVLNDSLDVTITFRKADSSSEDRLDYFITGSGKTEPVLFEGLHKK